MYGTKCNKNFGFDNDLFHKETVPRIRQAFKNFCEPLVAAPEVIYSIQPFTSNYIDAKILVLGGGGSTQRWFDKGQDLSGYDYVWAINNFFMNDYIRDNVHVDLFSVGPGVNLKDETLNWYLNKHQTIAAFELHQKWARDFVNSETGQMPEELWEEADKFYDNSRKCVFQTKFYSQLGGGVRMLIYGAQLGAASLDFIGFDGPQAIENGDHAFEKGKRAYPGAVRHLPFGEKEQVFAYQYRIFWSYFKRQFPATKVTSLDPSNKYHK